MALVKCKECSREVSDQAEACPHCGIKNPAETIAAPTAPRPLEGDDAILKLGGVTVTRTLAKFPSQTFPINGIGSVTLTEPKRTGWIIFALFFGLLTFTSFNAGPDTAGVGIFFLVLCGICAWVAFSKKHALFIRTASSDTRAMEGSMATLSKIKDAIEKAATARG